MFSLGYYKDIVNWLFLVLSACLATYIQSDTIVLQETFVLICRQKMNFIPMLLCRYSKVIQTYFGYFGHACFHSPKMIVSSCGKLRYLSTCKNKLHNSLLTILHFKESCNLIGWQHFGHNSRPKILPDMLLKYQ